MKTKCPHCDHIFEIPDVYKDKPTKCVKCKRTFTPAEHAERPPRPKVNYLQIAKKVRTQTAEQKAPDEDARYKRAKYRVIFFLNGCVTLFWFALWMSVIVYIIALLIDSRRS